MRVVVSIFVVSLGGSLAAFAQSAAVDDDHISACRDAVSRLMSAMDAADGPALNEILYHDARIGAQGQGLLAVVDCIVQQHALERALTERWGPGAAALVADDTGFTTADRASVRTARVERNGRSEFLVYLGAEVSPIVVHEDENGRMRVVLRTISILYDASERTPENGSRRRIEYMQAVAAQFREVASDIVSEKFASPEAARAALERGLDKAAVASATRGQGKGPRFGTSRR